MKKNVFSIIMTALSVLLISMFAYFANKVEGHDYRIRCLEEAKPADKVATEQLEKRLIETRESLEKQIDAMGKSLSAQIAQTRDLVKLALEK